MSQLEIHQPSAAELYAREVSELIGEYQFEDFSRRSVIPDKRIIVFSDAHVPYIDPELFAKGLADIVTYGITAVAWAGDLMDMHQFSNYGTTDYSHSYQDIKKMARKIIEQTARVLGPNGCQYITRGNHDHRWIRKLDNWEDMDGLYRSIGIGSMIDDTEVIVSDNPAIEAMEYLENGELKTRWLIVHPAQFKAPFKTPMDMALMEQKHVISAHAHHYGMTLDPSGKFWAVESGGLFDPRKFEYVQRSPNTMRRMVSGYWILREGEAPIGVCGNNVK